MNTGIGFLKRVLGTVPTYRRRQAGDIAGPTASLSHPLNREMGFCSMPMQCHVQSHYVIVQIPWFALFCKSFPAAVLLISFTPSWTTSRSNLSHRMLFPANCAKWSSTLS